MALIKKFRIKSFKEIKTLLQLEKISMFYNKRQILNNLNLKINEQEKVIENNIVYLIQITANFFDSGSKPKKEIIDSP